MSREASIKKVSSTSAARQAHEAQLISGQRLGMRMWVNEPPREKEATTREYETVGFVIAGRAELEMNGEVVTLRPGDAWLVPAGAKHHYRVLEPFTAVEATSPPAAARDGRD